MIYKNKLPYKNRHYNNKIYIYVYIYIFLRRVTSLYIPVRERWERTPERERERRGEKRAKVYLGSKGKGGWWGESKVCFFVDFT